MTKKNNIFYVLSPFFILIMTQAIAIVGGKYLNTYVYIPIILIYWGILGLFLAKYGISHIRKWLARPHGHWFWYILAGLIAFSSLPLFIRYYHLLLDLKVLVPTILFFLINPWIEEFYWRGILLDVTRKWPSWISILYSSLLFTLWHGAFAWYSELSRGAVFFLTVMLLGTVMALLYRQTKSLWLCIISHMIINILNLSIPSLLNLIEI